MLGPGAAVSQLCVTSQVEKRLALFEVNSNERLDSIAEVEEKQQTKEMKLKSEDSVALPRNHIIRDMHKKGTIQLSCSHH